MYVITAAASGGFEVGYFPSPGPECVWRTSLATIDDAIVEAEKCAAHLRAVAGTMSRSR